jgi:hypothetical protein
MELEWVVIASDELRTLYIHTDWDLPLVDRLKDLALIYYDWDWFEGAWEQLEALTAEILGNFGDDQTFSWELRQLYNRAVLERQKYDFAEEGTDDGGDVREAQQALVNELLEYHADPEMYIIVHAIDETHGDNAWFLCFLIDVEALGIDNSIQA